MYRRFHQRFGTAGVIVAVVALVVALSGTALAASGALTGKQKKEVEKIAKKFAGKNGVPGTNGTNGTNGKDGAPGASGKDGTNGKDGNPGAPGTPGTPGAAGKSVEELTITPGNPAECEGQGGAEYGVEGSGEFTQICNGKEGSPWTLGGTLPPGATETGYWSAQASAAGSESGVFVPISFAIPLAENIESSNTHYGEEGEEPFSPFCLGNSNNPKAKPGHLCVYPISPPMNTTFVGIGRFPGAENGVLRSGGVVEFSPDTSEEGKKAVLVAGTFAVTGCSAALPNGDPNKCP